MGAIVPSQEFSLVPLPAQRTIPLAQVWLSRMLEAQRRELLQALVIAQVAPLLAVERHPVRQARLIARAAAAIGAGRAAVLARDATTGLLDVLAVLDSNATPNTSFPGRSSGVTALPQLESLALGEGVIGTAAQGTGVVLVTNLAADSRFSPQFAIPDARVLGMEPHALCCLPVLDGTMLLGVLAVAQESDGPGFDTRTVDLLRALAAQASLAMAVSERERLAEQSHRRVAAIQDDERRRLARDLHDGPAQGIAHAVMTLESIDRLLAEHPEEARIELRRLHMRLTRTMREMRGVIFDLRPLALESDGLDTALQDLVARHQEPGGPQIQLVVDLSTLMPPEIEQVIYLVVREALANAIKHAHATLCLVEVRRGSDRVTALVRDNGTGFDADAVLANYPRGQSWGLLNMFERVRPFTDHFAIRARPGQGTEIALEILLPQV